MKRLVALTLLSFAVAAPPVRGDDAGAEFFEKEIRPLLVQHCYQCHSAAAKEIGGKLLVDHRAGLLQGGETGPAIVPGQPDKSLLIAAIRYDDAALQMPPKGKLPADAIEELAAWVKMAAPDPRTEPPVAAAPTSSWEETLRSRRDWWSLQAVRKPPVPTPSNSAWSADPIDRFILPRLEEQGLAPAEPADRQTLVRRLSLVLTGLPPEEERERLGDEEQSDQQLVDALLASPHFGERWARHWMDVVRFTETHGNEWNYEVHHAWRYRDYLIRAFNDDVPYDQFVREHIAGDLLPQPRWNDPDEIQRIGDRHRLSTGSARSTTTTASACGRSATTWLTTRSTRSPRRSRRRRSPAPAATITSSMRSRRRITTRCWASSAARGWSATRSTRPR